MRGLSRFLAVLGVNAVPLGGLTLAGWSPGTVLALYWFESLLASLLVAARIARHRRLTRKRGHYRPQLGVQLSSGSGPRQQSHTFSTFLAEFLTGSLAFTLAHGILALALVFGVLGLEVHREALETGILGVAAFQVIGFVTDLPGMGQRPFAWIRSSAQQIFGRVALLHVALIAGFGLLVWRQGTGAAFLPFLVLKTLSDLLGLWHSRLPSGPGVAPLAAAPPPWLASTMGRLGRHRGEDFTTYWAAESAREARQWAEDEEVGPHP